MEHNFTHSCVVLQRLARDTARTPPSDKDSPFEYVDRSLTILGRTSDIQSERMRQEFLGQRDFLASQFREVGRRFEEVDERFKKVDERFKKVDERFDRFEKRMDERFDRFEKRMDERFDQFEKKMDERFRRQFDHIQKASRNSVCTRGWQEIYPVGVFDYQGNIQIPEYFPRTVKRFWGLKHPSQRYHLTSLIRFYGVQGYEEWGRDADSLDATSDSDDFSENSSKSSRLPILLESAVQSNPDIAHQALAAKLGLAYDKIEEFMEGAQELSHARAREREKRKREEQIGEERKKRSLKRSPEEEGTDVTSPTEHLSSQ